MNLSDRTWLRVVLLGIVLLAAILRLSDLGLIELKGDEAVAIHMALPMVEGQSLPKVGLVNSVGLRNPPLFIYFVALPTWLSVDPKIVTGILIGVLSTAAVFATFFVVRRRFGDLVGVLSSLFFAAAPWPVLYGRKLWAQDVLPLFTVLLLWLFFVVSERHKTKWVMGIPITLCILWQLHLSAVGFILVAGVYLIVHARRIHWPALVTGTILATAMLTPYVQHQLDTDWSDIRGFQRMAQGLKPDGSPREVEKKWSADGITWSAYISAGNSLDYACGPSHDAYLASQSSTVRTIRTVGTMTGTALLAVGFLMCFGLAIRRRVGDEHTNRSRFEQRVDPLMGTRTMLWWTLGYLLVFTALRLEKVFPHYYIILYPAQFICMALPLGVLWRWNRTTKKLSMVILSIVITANVLTLFSFRQYLQETGGTAGDYGVAYQYKDELTQYVAATGLTLDGWRGWEYGHLVEMVKRYGDFEAATTLAEARGYPPESRRKARIYNTLRQPNHAKIRCEGRQDFGPLVLCPRR